ncbi:DUF4255 domain-containing protein [Paenibacillus sp. 22594]|uniref:DUF4255 domain-containing protein n=1 Tax=Paenibacillus sp. 22594 TaxID=3453947 RepID=UPI003F872474
MAVDTGTVIRDVSTSLKALLKAHVPELNDDSFISFGSPSDIDSSTMKLSMCLYYLSHSPSMRNSEKEEISGTNQFNYPPAYLDLYYLLTPYAKDRETEQLILGRIFQLFHEHPVLSGTDLRGNLAACGNDKIRISYNNLTIQDIKQLWEVFPGKPAKVSLSYLVSPVKLPADRSITIPRVQVKDLGIHPI